MQFLGQETAFEKLYICMHCLGEPPQNVSSYMLFGWYFKRKFVSQSEKGFRQKEMKKKVQELGGKKNEDWLFSSYYSNLSVGLTKCSRGDSAQKYSSPQKAIFYTTQKLLKFLLFCPLVEVTMPIKLSILTDCHSWKIFSFFYLGSSGGCRLRSGRKKQQQTPLVNLTIQQYNVL